MKNKTDDLTVTDAIHLLDQLLERYELKNDAELSRRMQILPSRISKMRTGRQPVTADLLLRVHETFDLSFAELRTLMRSKPPFLHSAPGRPGATQCSEKHT